MTWIYEVFVEIEKTAWRQVKSCCDGHAEYSQSGAWIQVQTEFKPGAQLTITRAFQITVEPKDTTTTLLKTSRHEWPKIPLSLWILDFPHCLEKPAVQQTHHSHSTESTPANAARHWVKPSKLVRVMQGHQLFMLNLSFRMVVSSHPSYFHRCPVLHIAHPPLYVSWMALPSHPHTTASLYLCINLIVTHLILHIDI